MVLSKILIDLTSGIVKRTDLAFFLLISLFSLLISICDALLSWMKSVTLKNEISKFEWLISFFKFTD